MTRLEEVQAKLVGLREWMSVQGLGTVVLNKRANFTWLTAGGDFHVVSASEEGVGRVVVTATGQWVLTSNIEAGRLADEELAGLPWEVLADNWHDRDDAAALAKLAVGAVATDTSWPEGARNVADGVSRLQWALLPPEQERYREAGRVCNHCLAAACRELEPGMTEYQIAALLSGKILSAGLEPIVVLVATDERIRKYRHPIPTGKRLDKHAELVLGGRYKGLVTSATRLVYFGDLPAELVDKHRAACTVDACFNLETQPGAAVKDIFRQAVETYAATGYADEWRLHHQGGGTGYGPRTYIAGPECPEVVLEGQAFAWNPSITGTKSEDTILAQAGGPEWLSAPTCGWPLVEVEWKGQKVLRPDVLVR